MTQYAPDVDTVSKFESVLQAMGLSDKQAAELAPRLRDGKDGRAAREVLQGILGTPDDNRVLDGVLRILSLQRSVRQVSGRNGVDAKEVSLFFDTILRDGLGGGGDDRAALEATSQGFAELDEYGRVRWHNSALGRLLGRADLLGEAAFDWLGGDQLASRFEEIVSTGGGTIKHRWVALLCSDCTRRVDLEMSVKVRLGTSRTYLFVRDSAARLEAQERAFAAADFGLVRTGPLGEIVSCNQHIARRLGGEPEDFIGHRVRDLAADDKERALIDLELDRRQRGEASTFIIKARVRGTDTTRHVRVAAFPEFDEDGTTHIATLAFARMIEPEHICQTLHAKMAEVTDFRQRVELIHQHITPLVPHDALVFSICDESGAWSWPAHVVPRPNPPWETRWFPISRTMRDWSLGARDRFGNILIEDVAHWYQMLPPEERLRRDPTVQKLVKSGVRSSLSVPVVLGKRIIASISLMRASGRPFDEVESSYLFELQLRETTLNLAFQYSRQEREFLNELHRVVVAELSASDGSSIAPSRDRSRHRTVGELVTRQLCEFYRWRAVEVFEIAVGETAFIRLAACEWIDDQIVASTDTLRKPLESGLLGRAHATGNPQLSPPRDGPAPSEAPEPPFKGSYPWAKSAISLPVKLQGRVVWIINIEDDRLDAFNEQEQKKLMEFVEYMQGALERLYMDSLLGEIFDNASDVILVVDADRRICFANERAAMVLQASAAELAGQGLEGMLLDPQDAERLLVPNRIREVRCAFRRPKGTPCYVIASAASWQNAFGLKIVYATELSLQTWHADLKVIEGALAQAARQSNNAVMRVCDFVRRLPEVTGDVNLGKEARRVEKHLADVKLTYDRIRKHLPPSDERYRVQWRPGVDLSRLPREAALEVAPNLPPEEWIKLYNCDTPCPIVGSHDDLVFVIRSILDYFRRRIADASHVVVFLRAEANSATVTLEIAAETDPPAPLPTDPFEEAYVTGVEMVALGSVALRRIVEREHGGEFMHGRRDDDEVEVFTLTLPREWMPLQRMEP